MRKWTLFWINVLTCSACGLLLTFVALELPDAAVSQVAKNTAETVEKIQNEQDLREGKQLCQSRLTYLVGANQDCARLIHVSVAVTGLNLMVILVNCWAAKPRSLPR